MKHRIALLLALAVCLPSALQAGEPVFRQSYRTSGQTPFEVSVAVPDGNYLVTVVLGDSRRAAVTSVKAESRRLCLYNEATAAGETRTVSFLVNKRDVHIRDKGVVIADVSIKDRERGKLDWDDNLTLEICGAAPAVSSITVEAAPQTLTVFLCGDSTVVDQDNEPFASWGQMAPCFFDDKVCVANYAESGERLDTFLAAGRLRKVLSLVRPGDYVFVEFGHNDMKLRGPGYGGHYYFATQLKIFVEMIRAAGATPVFVTPTHRRNFDDRGRVVETHGDYPDGMREVGRREEVAVLDLHSASALFYEALGVEASKKALVHVPAGSYPWVQAPIADNTHFSPYGAFELAKCVMAEIVHARLPLAAHLRNFSGFDPSFPDSPESFVWEPSPYRDLAAQRQEKDDAATVVKK